MTDTTQTDAAPDAEAPKVDAPPRVFSGIQPSGSLHLGNYFGAISNWVALQERFETIYCVVNYHARTGPSSADELRDASLEMALDILACGVDPERSILFVQSDVPQHTELAWLFSCVAPYGDLTRMTQFKEKSDAAKTESYVNAGLFTYPVLQAADILLYRANRVPVGADQLQHLELTRTIARRWNNAFGAYFPEVQAELTEGARIMSLSDPERKMSKSLGDSHYVGLMESKKKFKKKVMSAVTDLGLEDAPDEKSPGVANLFGLLRLAGGGEKADELDEVYAQKKLLYGHLKLAVFEALMEHLGPIRERREALAKDPDMARDILREGGRRARELADETLEKTRALMGLDVV